MQMQQVKGVATVVRYDKNEDMQVVTYHQTDVVKFDSFKIILNTGGWKTSTTKARMNQASNQFNLGYSVFQKDFSWYVTFKGEEIEFKNDTLELNR